jgi:lysozyme
MTTVDQPKRSAGRKAAPWLAATVALVGGFEGLRTVAYRDPVAIPTVCFGETRGVKMGDRYTTDECKAMLADRLEEFAAGAQKCVPELVDAAPGRRAAHISLAYNIGLGSYCKSTVARQANAGNWDASCHAFLMWNKARGIPLPGLQRRREEEMRLCLG